MANRIRIRLVLSTQLLVDILQRVTLLQAVVVERNLLTYYRLPTSSTASQTFLNSNDTNSYYVMQCPFRPTLTIPKPREMPICVIVGRFSETGPSYSTYPAKQQKLNTRVDYGLSRSQARSKTKHKPKRMIKVVKVKSSSLQHPPPVTIRRPTANPTYHRSKSTNTLRRSKPLRSELDNERTILKPIRVAQDYEEDFLLDEPMSSSEEEEEKEEKAAASNSKEKHSNVTHPLRGGAAAEMSKEESNYSPLKYLGVKDAIEVLKIQNPGKNAPFGDTEKFFADQKNYTKGVQTKAYHNIYHRDESFNDHIFYDDVQQHGNYDHHQKVFDGAS